MSKPEKAEKLAVFHGNWPKRRWFIEGGEDNFHFAITLDFPANTRNQSRRVVTYIADGVEAQVWRLPRSSRFKYVLKRTSSVLDTVDWVPASIRSWSDAMRYVETLLKLDAFNKGE